MGDPPKKLCMGGDGRSEVRRRRYGKHFRESGKNATRFISSDPAREGVRKTDVARCAT